MVTIIAEPGNAIGESEYTGLRLYPNPAANEIFLDATEVDLKIELIKIIDFEGKTVNTIRQPQTVYPVRIDLSGMNQGVYLIQVVSDDSLFIYRIRIER